MLHLLAPGIGSSIVSYDDADESWKSGDDKWYTKFVKGLNIWLNGEHRWFDYDSWNDVGDAAVSKLTGSALTPAEREANAFTADEAQKARDWEEYMSNTSYQRQVADMQKAGVNPALTMTGGIGGASTPTSPSPSSVTPTSGMNMSDLLQLIMVPMQRKLMEAQSKLASDQGEAALITAKANAKNADTNVGNLRVNERNAGTNEFNAETARMRQEIDAFVSKYDIRVKEATADNLAANTAQVLEFTSQLPKRLEIMQQTADAQTRSALASLQSALAATRQAAVAEKLSDSEIALRESQALVNWANKDGQEIINRYLPEHQQKEIQELASRGNFLEANVRNLDRNAKVQWMQTITGYTNAACNVTNSVMNVLGGISLLRQELVFSV